MLNVEDDARLELGDPLPLGHVTNTGTKHVLTLGTFRFSWSEKLKLSGFQRLDGFSELPCPNPKP